MYTSYIEVIVIHCVLVLLINSTILYYIVKQAILLYYNITEYVISNRITDANVRIAFPRL